MFSKQITFLLLLGSLSLQQCGQGCLKCGDQNTCLVCNYSLGYSNQNGVCIQQIDTRCLFRGADGTCSTCNPGYRTDPNSFRCIPLTGAVQNCLYYSDKGDCGTCQTDYYTFEGRCLMVTSKVSNCLIYWDASRCDACEPWYTISDDLRTCTKDPEIANCAAQTNFVCETCKSGFIKNPNNYIEVLFSQNQSSRIQWFLMSLGDKVMTNAVPNICQKLQHKNCATPVNAFECQTCENQFYLAADKTCYPFPFIKINNCTKYSNSDVCAECENGYFLFNTNKECKVHTSQNVNCQTFSQVQDNKCVLCKEDYFITGDSCQIRVDSKAISNCSVKSITSDQCQTCANSFLVTSDGKKCLALINNCLQYNPGTTVNSTNHTCFQCGNQTYLSTDFLNCIAGALAFCEIYIDQNTCSKCINKYYLNQGVCTIQPDIEKCSVYSGNIAKQCDVCQNEFFVLSLVNHCQLATTINGCFRYTDNQTCQECQESYYLNAQNTCTLITLDQNCLRGNNTICTKCKATHFLWQNQCIPHHHYQQLNCLTPLDITSLTIGHQNMLQCVSCKSDFIWKSLSGNNLCIETGKLPTAQQIVGCIRYTKVANDFVCEQCGSGYWLSDTVNPTCLQSCATPQKVRLTFDNVNNKLNIINWQNNYCNTGNQNNVYQTDSSLVNQLVIGNCDAGMFGVYSSVDTTYNYASSMFSNAHSYTVYDSCQNSATKTSLPDFLNNNNNCKHYIQKGGINGQYYCITCKTGFTGKISVDGAHSYVTCDTRVIGCSTEQWGGFILDKTSQLAHGINTSQFYSCHRCAAGYLPFLFAPLNNLRQVLFNDFRPFNMDNLNPQQNGGDDLQLQCLIPVASSFQMNANQFTLSFPTNCGLGLFDTSINKEFTQSPKSLYCVECSDGFKKVTDVNNLVTQCKQIPNCDALRSDKWFNNCSKCENTHSWGWSSTRGIHFDECIQRSIQNCLVTENQAQQQNCIYCEKGFDLIDGRCEKYTVPYCTSFLQNRLSIQRHLVNTSKYDNFWLIANLYQHKGCETCVSNQSNNYVSVFESSGIHQACVASYIQQNQKQLSFQGIIPNCVFQSGNSTICLQCKEGYIMRVGGTECLINTSYADCTAIDVLNKCISCTTGFHLIQDKCVRGTISNCIQYDAQQQDQRCLKCAENYKPRDNNKSCVLGYLNYCKFYENKQQASCMECQAKGLSFRYKVTSEDRYMCYLSLEDLNCEILQTPNDINLTNQYQCSTCKPGYFKTQDQTLFNRSRCISHQGHDVNCLTYNASNPSLFANDFQCNQCKEGYYQPIFGYRCELRTITIANCTILNPFQQNCLECGAGFYLAQNTTECIAQPTGVKECRNYTDNTTCKECNIRFFLQNNQCVAVPNAELIPNCHFYTPDKKCERCNTNFLLVNLACVEAVAKNCLTLTNLNTCATCLADYYLKKSDDGTVTSCTFKKILNCSMLDVQTGRCSQCQTQYYVDANGDCQLAQFIPKCLVYLTLNTCKQCNESYYVSENNEKCEIQGAGVIHDQLNCQNLVFNKNKECMVCKAGYYFVNGKCEACQSGVGCAICDYRKPNVCLMCDDQYHQTTLNGPCTKSNMVQFAEPSSSSSSTIDITLIRLVSSLMFLILY